MIHVVVQDENGIVVYATGEFDDNQTWQWESRDMMSGHVRITVTAEMPIVEADVRDDCSCRCHDDCVHCEREYAYC